MGEPPRESIPVYEGCIARVVWAAHILSYMTRKRNHIELQQPDAAEEEGLDFGEVDAETERTAVLQGPRESIRSKFLDCVAQLLSPSKGWESVTATALREQEDFVEIDVARNDCFGIARNGRPGQHTYNFGKAEADYCRKLEYHLSAKTQQALSSEFELTAISYTGRRIDHCVEQLRALLNSVSLPQDWGDQRPLAIKTWKNFIKILQTKDNESTKFREQIVQRAYECVASADVHELLHIVFEAKIGSKLWYALKFVARPIMDCRMLWHIAKRYPQFREVRIFPVPPRPKKSISLEYQIDISEAWARLSPASAPGSELRMIALFGKQFKQDCAASYSLHAEIQLFMHYEDSPDLTSTLSYFGCSKKACLLCDTFLKALPNPIATRGRHGICYPAWGCPTPRSAVAETALKKLETMLVSRIKSLLYYCVRAQKTYFAPAVPQSTLVSDISDSTSQELLQREGKVKSANEVEMVRRKERLILEGAAVTSQPPDSSYPDFEPYDSCDMCNTSPAKRCKRCLGCCYCSRVCQKSDWPSHKLLCKSFSTQAPRPSSDHKRAILFPVDRRKPRMIWLPCERKVEHEESGGRTTYETVNFHPHLGVDRPGVKNMRIEHNPIRDRNLGSGMVYWAPRKDGYSVSLNFRDTFMKDGSPVNRSILTSVGTFGITPHRWCGPIVAVRETSFEFYEDITLADFRHIIDHVISYRTTGVRESTSHPEDRLSTSIRGVKICCYGETKLNGSEPYVSVDVPRAHPTRLTYGQGAVSPISKLLGMPLKLWKFSAVDSWIDPPGWDENTTGDSNQNAALLMMETDLEKPNWGWAPLYWNTDLGNVLAVRQDDHDLAVDHVRTMCYFAVRKLQPMFENALSASHVPRTKQEVLNYITWENMMKCSDEMAEESGDLDTVY